MGFLFGIPRKLIKRITEIEIDTHYYDKDVVPSNQEIFTYSISRFGTKDEATITGFKIDGVTNAVIPYRIKFGDDTSNMYANVNKLDVNAFKNYTSIQNITIPNTIHVIPEGCFSGCTSLWTCNIPKSVDTIEKNAFKNCSKLDTLFIPYTVKNIAEGAFDGCTELNIICYKGSTAETYAQTYNIPYSLISYTLDKDITEDSPNLVTSGVIWSNVKKIFEYVNSHINNKNNPHDDSTFNNSELIGNTTIIKGTLNDVITNDEKSLVNVDYVNDVVTDLETEINEDITNLETNVNNSFVEVNNSINILETNIDNDITNLQQEINDKLNNLQQKINNIGTPEVGSGYQTIYDNRLQTDTKTITSAINEINDKVNTVHGTLTAGWNTISLNKLYPISWMFINKPYCYTDEGLSVDYRIKDLQLIENEMNAFRINVPVDCNYTCSTTNSNEISGIPIDYLIVDYYYTGADGKDLDTVTEISNSKWPSSVRNTIGYGHQPDVPITNNSGIELVKFSGDNTGGGNENATTKYHECVYFNIGAIQQVLRDINIDEDIEITLYAGWYSSIGNGHINVSLKTYTNEVTPLVIDNGYTFTLKVNNEELIHNYENNSEMQCYVANKIGSGSASKYTSTYTPTFKLIFHKTTENSNYRTITIQPLS